MIVNIFAPRDYNVLLNNTEPKETVNTDNQARHCFDIAYTEQLIIKTVYTKKSLIVKPFRKGWFNSVISTFLCTDYYFNNDIWVLTAHGNENSTFHLYFVEKNISNTLSGKYNYLVLNNLKQKNGNIQYRKNCRKYSKDKAKLWIMEFANLLPFILLLIDFLYKDIMLPYQMWCGTFYIFVFDIPLFILILILIFRFYIKFSKDIENIKNDKNKNAK